MQVRRLMGALAVGVLVAACGSSGPATPASGDIQATQKEWQISLSSTTLTTGSHTFNITNNGDETHEFVIVKTDLADDALPTVGDEIDEESDQFTAVDEVEDVTSGSSDKSLTADLAPGHYVIFCNITGHYNKGMHVVFTVE